MRYIIRVFSFALFVFVLTGHFHVVFAQTWDMHRWVQSVKKVKAQIIDIDRYQRTLTLKVVTNSMTGEYKTGWCSVDDQTKIIKEDKEIKFTDLRERDHVNVGGIIYRDARKSCQLVQVVQ